LNSCKLTKPGFAVSHFSPQDGLTLVELLVTLLLSAFLILGLTQMVSAAGNSFRLQDNQAEVQENGRYALLTLRQLIRQAGFNPQPWNPGFEPQGLTPESADRISTHSDRLVLRSWSNTNCFGNRNPAMDDSGEAAFHIRESLFDLNSSKNLAHTCRYGPTPSEFVTQINHQGLVRNVESFQALFGEDINDDGQVDRWVKGGEWDDQERVLGIRIGLLLSSTDAVLEAAPQLFRILDSEYKATADGRLRRLFLFATTIRGRTG
jgi:type IV pilus assembly protein PilW